MNSTPRILVVDDNADAANSLCRLLKLIGYEVRVSHDGQSAIAEFESFQPRVVLLDLGMPGMDGYETSACLRQLTGGQQADFIAVTGWGHDRDRQRTKSAGFIAHLIKPVNLEQLEAILAQIFHSPANK